MNRIKKISVVLTFPQLLHAIGRFSVFSVLLMLELNFFIATNSLTLC
jgi:hypothetical protein